MRRAPSLLLGLFVAWIPLSVAPLSVAPLSVAPLSVAPLSVALAQSSPGRPDDTLLSQNELLAEVARKDPDYLWTLVTQLGVLVTHSRNGGAARSGAAATQAELTEIDANPALRLAYTRDAFTTLALLRATHDDLRRAQRQEQSKSKRLALVVGSSGDARWGKLTTTTNDAGLVADVLAQQGFALSGGAPLIDPDKPHLAQAIREFARAIGPDTVALFYYAGHGLQENARNFIVPNGAPMPRSDNDYDRNLVAVDDVVLRAMQEADAKLSIIILDACRVHPPLAALAQRAAPGLAPMGSRSSTGGAIIIYSTGPNSIAHDSGPEAADSPFASAFAKAVSQGGEIRDVFARTQLAVDQASDHQQQPWISYSTADTFYFADVPKFAGLADGAADGVTSWCPAPGTTATLFLGAMRTVVTYQPVSPSAPAICRVAGPVGQSWHLLYNLYELDRLTDWSRIEAALKPLISGERDHVEFQVHQQYGWGSSFEEVWQRLGSDFVAVNGKRVSASVFERDVRPVRALLPILTDHHRSKIWYAAGIGIVEQVELASDGAPIVPASDAERVIAVQPF
jgi:hypothetical protein